MPAAEFDLPAGHLDAPALPAVRFPETGRPEADVLDDVRGRFDEDRFEPDRNFSITYSGIPSAISQQVEELARGRFFVEWARETELGHLVDGARGRGDDGVAARRRRRGRRVHHDRRHRIEPGGDAPRPEPRAARPSPRSSRR